jgi:hypothetical protein
MGRTNDGRILAVALLLASAAAGCSERVACLVEVSSGPETCVLFGEERSKELVRSSTTCPSGGKRAKKCPDGAKKICRDEKSDVKYFYYAAYESQKNPTGSMVKGTYVKWSDCEAHGRVTVTE